MKGTKNKEERKTMTRVNTNEYRRSHGKEPRGWGGWVWAFYKEGNFTGHATFYGNYGETKKQALAYAKKHGFDEAAPQP